LDKLGIDGESSEDESFSEDEFTSKNNSEATDLEKKEFELCFRVPLSMEETINLINKKYEECKLRREITYIDNFIDDIQKDISKLKEQTDTLELLLESAQHMEKKLEKEIKEENDKQKEQQLKLLKENLGEDIAKV